MTNLKNPNVPGKTRGAHRLEMVVSMMAVFPCSKVIDRKMRTDWFELRRTANGFFDIAY